MLKLGNGTINKVALGSTEINKVYLGSTVVYESGEPPEPTEVLLEGFEIIDTYYDDNEEVNKYLPIGETLNWDDLSFDYMSLKGANTEWYTEGSQSLDLFTSSALPNLIRTLSCDLSEYQSLKLDVKNSFAIPDFGASALIMKVSNETSSLQVSAPKDTTQHTITLNISSLGDLSNCIIELLFPTDGYTTSVDNLRGVV